MKGTDKKISMITAYDYTMAKIVDESGVNTILVGDSLGNTILGYEDTISVTVDDMIHHSAAVARGAKNALVITDMPFMSYQTSVYDAVVNAGRIMKEGRAGAVKLEGGQDMCPQISAIVKASIPVCAHLGLTPQSINAFGGFKVQGKTEAAAKKLIEDAKAVEEAGAFMLVMECVPEKLAKIVTETVSIPTIGIGAGRYCDGQVLVNQDMFGMYSDFVPKFVKQFANVGDVMRGAVKAYIDEINAEVILKEKTIMVILKKIDEVRAQVKEWKKQGLTVGLVPTMGYLHEGHQSLIKKSVEQNDRTVVSVFVNPIQFGPNEDLESYPRDLEADAKLCESTGADIIFNPEPEEMYADGFVSFINMTGLPNALCGLTRPIHFKGVCTVVGKLFNIVTPDRAYFGQKDAQQLAIIMRMVKDLNFDIEIVGCPIIREADGLAKSSRNIYLTPEERKAAVVLSKAVKLGQDMIADGERDAAKIVGEMKKLISAEPLATIDYVEMVNMDTMQSIEKAEGHVLCAMAVKFGKARLIDNFIAEL